MEFSNLLEEPINNANLRLNELKEKLGKPGQDTAALRQQIKNALHACFDIPREYMRRYPNSSLDIIALRFMGSGDPTVPHPVQELADLFHSLDPRVQNSEIGRNYFERLQKLLTR